MQDAPYFILEKLLEGLVSIWFTHFQKHKHHFIIGNVLFSVENDLPIHLP